jgi:hypothetical protein
MVQTLHYVTVQLPLPFDEARVGLNYDILLDKLVERFNGRIDSITLVDMTYMFTNFDNAYGFEEELKNWEFKVG